MASRLFARGGLALALGLGAWSPLVLAQGGAARQGEVQVFEGTIDKIDTDRQTLTLLRANGNSLTGEGIRGTSRTSRATTRPRGRRLVVAIPADAQIFLDHTGAKLGGLKGGMKVRVYASQRIRVVGETTRSTADRDTDSGPPRRNRAKDTISGLGRASGRGKVQTAWVAVRIEAATKARGPDRARAVRHAAGAGSGSRYRVRGTPSPGRGNRQDSQNARSP
jgi:hypothetical protein